MVRSRTLVNASGLIMAAGLVGSAAHAAGESRSATPVNNPATWVTTLDYPPQAMRENREGSVDFFLTVSPDGRVTECVIRGSSGSPLLDKTTCDLVMQRARFSPAIDPSGKPISGTYRNRVRWTIPHPPPPEAGEIVLSYVVAPDGTRSDCKVESAVGGAAAAVAKGDPCRAGNFSRGYVDEAGQPVSRRVRSKFTIEVLPVQ